MAIPTNREITSHQITDCLHVLATTSNFLCAKDEFKEGAASGEHRAALEVTLIKVCDRLEKIFEDDSRWTVQKIDGHIYQSAIAGEQFRQLALGTRLVQLRLDRDAENAQRIKEDASRHVEQLISMMTLAPNPTVKKRKKK